MAFAIGTFGSAADRSTAADAPGSAAEANRRRSSADTSNSALTDADITKHHRRDAATDAATDANSRRKRSAATDSSAADEGVINDAAQPQNSNGGDASLSGNGAADINDCCGVSDSALDACCGNVGGLCCPSADM